MTKDQEFFKLSSPQMAAQLQKKAHTPLTPIDSADISVIIQGPVFEQKHKLAPHGITFEVLKALRQHLPKATLILSTWKNQPVDNLDADIILKLDDPGTTNFYAEGAKAENLFNNGNRLIYSTQQGLAHVNTKYTLKIRSDLLMFHPLFSSYFNHFDQADANWKVLKQRIIGFPIYSLKFEKGFKKVKHLLFSTSQEVLQPRPFHVSDWAYFGLTEDMKQLFNCSLMPEPTTSRWFENRPKPDNDIWPERLWRYSPEQYITSNLAKRTLSIELQHTSQDDKTILDASNRFIANNFMILDQAQWGLWSLKLQNYQDNLGDGILPGLYSHAVWYKDYQEFAHSSRVNV